MKTSVLRSQSFRTSLSSPANYELSPSDAIFGLQLWFSPLMFFPSQLDWDRLRDALGKVEQAYPPLCGSYVEDENSTRSIVVNPEEDNGFTLVEIEVDATLAQLRSSGRMMSCCRECDIFNMSWPYFLKANIGDFPATYRHSLIGFHLTRAKDGCVFSLSQYHILCDGAGGLQLIANIGRAYSGLVVDAPHLDRSLMWPDQYLAHFAVPGHSPDMYPRRFVPRRRELEDETSHVAEIHLKQDVINRMKLATKGHLKGVDFVSSSDLLVGLCWLLRAESVARKRSVPASGLPIEGTSVQFPVDTRATCVPVVPANYFGNAIGRGVVTYPLDERPDASRVEKLAHAASLIRRAVRDVQTKQQSALEALLVHYKVGCTLDTALLENCLGVVAANPMFYGDLNFGQPLYLFIPMCFPCTITQSFIQPRPDGDGAFLQFVVSIADRNLLKTSAVLAECAPGAAVFSQGLNEEQAAAFIALRSRM